MFNPARRMPEQMHETGMQSRCLIRVACDDITDGARIPSWIVGCRTKLYRTIVEAVQVDSSYSRDLHWRVKNRYVRR